MSITASSGTGEFLSNRKEKDLIKFRLNAYPNINLICGISLIEGAIGRRNEFPN
jgi:hypothetical protein